MTHPFVFFRVSNGDGWSAVPSFGSQSCDELWTARRWPQDSAPRFGTKSRPQDSEVVAKMWDSPPVELDLCRTCCARKRTHPRGIAILAQALAHARGRRLRFRQRRMCPYGSALHGFSFSAAVGTWLWNCTFSESPQPRNRQRKSKSRMRMKGGIAATAVSVAVCASPLAFAQQGGMPGQPSPCRQSNVRCAAAVVYAARQ